MTEFNLPEPDDAPWLNLSPQEIEELRTSKKELTEYGKEKICKLMNKEPTHEEMLEEAARRELANKEFKDLTEQERIKLALEELGYYHQNGIVKIYYQGLEVFCNRKEM